MYPAEEDDETLAPAAKKSDLVPRVLSALVLVPAALAALYFGGTIWAILVALCAIGLCVEWANMVCDEADGRAMHFVIGISVLSALAAAFFYEPVFSLVLGLAIALPFMLWGVATFERGRFWIGFGVFYLTIASVALYWLRVQTVPNGFVLVLFLLVCVWASDIGAYFVGRSVGGPKIFPSISPNKTWSGSLGGVAIAGLCAAAFKPAFGLNGSYFGLVVVAVGLSAVSQAGDAFESALKRKFQIKDSGNIIPGHGGVLDRLDALLLAAPVMAAFIWFSK